MKDYQTMTLVGSEPAADVEGRFNSWYDGTHVPMLLQCPKLLAAARYKISPVSPSAGPRYLATYSFANGEAHQAFQSSHETKAAIAEMKGSWADRKDAFQLLWNVQYELRNARGRLERNPESTMLLVGTRPKPELDDKVDRWYNETHLPMLLESGHLMRAVRYGLARGADVKYPPYLVVYEFENVQGYGAYAASPERKAAGEETARRWLAGDVEVVWQVLYEPIKSWSRA